MICQKKLKCLLLRKAKNFMIKGELGIFGDCTLKTLAVLWSVKIS